MTAILSALVLEACSETSKNVDTDPTRLWIPPVIEGDTFDRTLSESSETFLDGDATPTHGDNGGPSRARRSG